MVITSKVNGYRRCGVQHPARPTEHPDDRFSEEQMAVLKTDPILTVRGGKAKDPIGRGRGKSK